ncbi:molybdopterin-containing oxidoreductase family protein [Oceanithermus sp.]
MPHRVTCPLDCPDRCRLLVTVEDGRVVRVTGDPDHPTTRGFACVKTNRWGERQHHPDRPLYPMRRVGPKGAGRFERASWDEALDAIAERLGQVLDEHGGQAVARYHYAGTTGLSEGRRPVAFFRAIGACELDETICASAGGEAWEMAYGPHKTGTDPENVGEAELIVLWGTNPLSTNTHLVPFLKEARRSGAEIWHVDPYENRTARFADRHLKIRPGTDAALAYAVARVLFEEGLVDWGYLNEHAEGVEAFRAAAAAWTPERAAELTGLEPADILELARRFGRARPGFIRVGYGMTRQPGGGDALRAVVLLPALTGAWKHPAGGALLSTSGAFRLASDRLEGEHWLRRASGAAGYFRPDPGVRTVNQSEFASALTRWDPPIRMLFVFNANPAVSTPDSARVRAGLAREDLFTVVLENALSETARYADWLLPATTFLEHPDLYTSYGTYWLHYSEAVMEPAGEARPNTWVFAELARRLGLDLPELYWSAEEAARIALDGAGHPYLANVSFERLRAAGSLKLNLPRPFTPHAQGANTLSGKVRFDPPPRVAPPETTDAFPYLLMTPPAHHFLGTIYAPLARLRAAEGGEPEVWIHPDDAAREGLVSGVYVWLESEAGQVKRRLRVTDRVQPGVLVMEGTWPMGAAPDGEPANTLTPERLTDVGRQAIFHGIAVRLVRVS